MKYPYIIINQSARCKIYLLISPKDSKVSLFFFNASKIYLAPLFVKLLYDISTLYKTSFIFNVSANPFANKSHSLFLDKHKSLRVTFSFNDSHN